MTTKMNKAVLPMVGIGMAAAAVGIGMTVAKPSKNKKKVQTAAGKALKAVGEAVENFSCMMMKK